MEDYRLDDRSRCSRCKTPIASADLFMTIDGESLCPSCHVTWAGEQMKFVGTEEGPRLFCPTCGAATMRSRGGQMRMDATCARCGATTARWRPLGVLLATVSIMWSFMFAAFQVAHIPVVPVLVVCLCACFVAVEIAGRRRFRTATFDEIEAADRLLAEEHAAKTKKAYLAAVEASSPVGEVAEEASDDAEERVGKRAG